jgi:hypothetical protein
MKYPTPPSPQTANPFEKNPGSRTQFPVVILSGAKNLNDAGIAKGIPDQIPDCQAHF